MTIDRAKLLGESEPRATRLQQINESHIAPLTAFVESLRAEAGPGASIPYFDPWDGGVDAKILFLLEAPGPKAVGSSFISRNNPDETAKNFFELSAAAQIPRKKPSSGILFLGISGVGQKFGRQLLLIWKRAFGHYPVCWSYCLNYEPSCSLAKKQSGLKLKLKSFDLTCVCSYVPTQARCS